jgi:hypothetical protein
MQQLATSYHTLQQQLLALSNQIDPAAAVLIAAAAAGDESAARFHPVDLPTDMPQDCEVLLPADAADGAAAPWQSWLTGSYIASTNGGCQALQSCKPTTAANSRRIRAAGAAGSSSTGSFSGVSPAAAEQPHEVKLVQDPMAAANEIAAANDPQLCPGQAARCHEQPGLARPHAGGRKPGTHSSIGVAPSLSCDGGGAAGTPAACASTTGPSASIRGGVSVTGVLRHLPVAVRLLRLEASLQDISSGMHCKADSGELPAACCSLPAAP